jgi:hypothetical protein
MRHSKVQDLGFAIFSDEDVVWFEIPVDHASQMSMVDGFANVCQQTDPLIHTESLLASMGREWQACHQLHGEEGMRTETDVEGPGLIDARDSRVIQSPQDVLFELETVLEYPLGKLGAHDLQRDRALRGILDGLEDNPHAPLTDLSEDRIVAHTIRHGIDRLRVDLIAHHLERDRLEIQILTAIPRDQCQHSCSEGKILEQSNAFLLQGFRKIADLQEDPARVLESTVHHPALIRCCGGQSTRSEAKPGPLASPAQRCAWRHP